MQSPSISLSECHRFLPRGGSSVLETLQSHPPAPENLVNGQRVKRHLKKIRGPNTMWEPFSSPSLLPTLCQYSSNESSCLPAANVTACVCHLAGGVNSAPKAAFSNTALPARMTGHGEQPTPLGCTGLTNGMAQWPGGLQPHSASRKGVFQVRLALSPPPTVE